jgi:hypothetical protein
VVTTSLDGVSLVAGDGSSILLRSPNDVVGIRAPGRGVAETEGGREAGTAAKDTVGGSMVRLDALFVRGILENEGVPTGVDVRSWDWSRRS